MFKIKPGVNISGIQPELVLGLCIAERVYEQHGRIMRITSVLDGQHSRESLHYVGFAADLGIKDGSWNVYPQDDLDSIVKLLKESLGPQFDVVLEKDHIHIEFQPKRYD